MWVRLLRVEQHKKSKAPGITLKIPRVSSWQPRKQGVDEKRTQIEPQESSRKSHPSSTFYISFTEIS